MGLMERLHNTGLIHLYQLYQVTKCAGLMLLIAYSGIVFYSGDWCFTINALLICMMCCCICSHRIVIFLLTSVDKKRTPTVFAKYEDNPWGVSSLVSGSRY